MKGTTSYAIEWIDADGSGQRAPLLHLNNFAQPSAWTADGKALVFYQTPTIENGRDIWAFRPGDSKSEIPLLATRFQERAPRLSPDNRWLAYVSNASGRDEVYVRAFPQAGEQITISNDGGGEPVWSRNGRELFYRNGDRMMVVPVSTSGTAIFGQPKVVFQAQFANSEPGGQNPNYDVDANGRFLMVTGEANAAPRVFSLSIVLNWFEELKQRAPAR